ncbi:RNA polymerase sigma factor [Mangrovivirga cuniculi]|uniref:Sigma-70 family RNA polymerase sigma factor n=1 Tax=Mangrovivirga cuniculi TaxID=2715131 RepID=A0A4D7KB68_9BACT|nr:sigma-70 family RNA polymerase sigma factor [Mangrovivirga cuniculi]QCK16638.1 sigma-70 family RNA polymerase sigma factor [Mangrovivirga cuniculi]
MNDKEIISGIKSGNKTILKDLYLDNKNDFVGFAHKYSSDDILIEDIFQDAIIVFYEKAISGKIDSLKCSLKTYLFSIGKYMIFDKNRKSVKEVQSDDLQYVLDSQDYYLIDDLSTEEELSPYQEMLYEHFKKLGEKCRKVLQAFYYKGQTIEEIMIEEGYENKNVVKSQKSRCLKALKEMINKSHE